MADTDAMRKDFEQWKQDNGVVGGGTLLDRIYFAGWQKGQSRALASRPAEADDMMPVTEPVAWRHTLDEGLYFANGRNYQLLDDWDAAFADWMLHGGVMESLYRGADTHELAKEKRDE